MSTQIEFTKMVASGNDFIVIDHSAPSNHLSKLAQRLCDRKLGIGADGVLVLEKSAKADIRMRVFNPDGSEADMCGNGARCIALYISKRSKAKSVKLETGAGIIDSQVDGDNVRIRLTDPRDIKLDIPLKLNGRTIKVDFINTGVPHAVIFAHGLNNINIVPIGRQVRLHKHFAPAGTNVDFVEVADDSNIALRTYERGVEDETLACGTGTVASALISALKSGIMGNKQTINAATRSGEILKVYFDRAGAKFTNVWLEGRARFVFTGKIAL
jgi:diaminopimelate epimerase